MSNDDRLAALKRAKWRADLKARGAGQCRICHGACAPQHHYCLRHFRMLSGYPELCALVKNGELLEEADALIALKLLGGMRRLNSQYFQIGENETLRGSRRTDGVTEWVLRKDEIEVARFGSLHEFRQWYQSRRHDFSVHNRWATKTVIR